MKGRVVILQVISGDVIPGYAAGEKGELMEDSESSHWWMVVDWLVMEQDQDRPVDYEFSLDVLILHSFWDTQLEKT